MICALLASAVLAAPAVVSAAPSSPCTFTYGFQELHDLIPDVVGDCLANASGETPDGYSTQPTSRGELFWRRLSNASYFSDGLHTWVLGPCGLGSRRVGTLLPWERGDPCSDGSAPWLGFRQLADHQCTIEGGSSRDFQGSNQVVDPTAVFSTSDTQAAFYLKFVQCTLPSVTFVKWDIFDEGGQYFTSTQTGIPAGGYRLYSVVTFLQLGTRDQPLSPGTLRLNVSLNEAFLGTYWIAVE